MHCDRDTSGRALPARGGQANSGTRAACPTTTDADGSASRPYLAKRRALRQAPFEAQGKQGKQANGGKRDARPTSGKGRTGKLSRIDFVFDYNIGIAIASVRDGEPDGDGGEKRDESSKPERRDTPVGRGIPPYNREGSAVENPPLFPLRGRG